MKSTPLAWKNLTADWRRLALGICGVAFAAILMFMQNGFRNALLDSPVQLLHAIRCDLVATSVARFSLPTDQTFPRLLLERAQNDLDVRASSPVYLERLRAQVRIGNRARRPIRVIAIRPDPGWFLNADIASQLHRLVAPQTALLDRRTRSIYGFGSSINALKTQPIELANQRLQVVGLIDIGTDFANDGSLLISDHSFASYFPDRGGSDSLSQVDVAIFQLREQSNAQEVAARLTAMDPQVWTVLTKEDFIEREIQFWNRQTPIGMIFFIGSMMGFSVGIIICYQILFNSIHDSLPEFATLKAMGYENRYFISLVIKQALYLSVLGFVPAVFVSGVLFECLHQIAGLPMLFTPGRIASVLLLTIVMCLVSGLLTLRKLLNADPASLF